MGNTKTYRTRTMFEQADNTIVQGYWPMGIDIGYGGCKMYAPNICATFPSYARIIDEGSLIRELAYDDIVYKDTATGQTWLVGRSAQNMIQSDDTNDSIEALCGRNRYYTPLFLVLARVCMAIGMMSTINAKYTITCDDKIMIQTGLPCQYLKSDTPMIKEVMSGHHDFEMQIGQGQRKHFIFDIDMENVKVMRQPMGAFISAATDANWNQNIAKFSNANVLIFDPGFKTLDTFSVRGGSVDSHESWGEYGMSRVLTETSIQIFNDYGEEIPVANMQKNLETGTFVKFNRKERKTSELGFSQILESKSRMVCLEALNKAGEVYNDFVDYRYMILAGGTGAAWSDWIVQELKDMNSLKVITGDTPDGKPMIFANARGYYSYLIGSLKNR